jgi:P-aminobenzoate N-oxygenase AurF
MFHDFNYPAVLAASTRAAWQIDDVIGPGAALDFSRPFMPEKLARTKGLYMLSGAEKLTLNHIRAHEYLSLFGLVEEFILPFVLDHVRDRLPGNDETEIRAMLNFASEEAKHIQLFKRFQQTFREGFATECEMIGPPEAVAKVVLSEQPLSVALFVLMIEWMTQSHYLDSVKDDAGLDPLFADLLRYHWMEEAQHAKLDTLMVEALAEGKSEAELHAAVDGFLDIVAFFDTGCRQQAKFNLDALEAVHGPKPSEADRLEIMSRQHQALRWTYLGSGLVHKEFRRALGALSLSQLERIDALAPKFQ